MLIDRINSDLSFYISIKEKLFEINSALYLSVLYKFFKWIYLKSFYRIEAEYTNGESKLYEFKAIKLSSHKNLILFKWKIEEIELTFYYKCDNHKKSNLKCGLHKESLMDQEQLSFVSCEILSPAGKYCHVIKDFTIWEHLPSICC